MAVVVVVAAVVDLSLTFYYPQVEWPAKFNVQGCDDKVAGAN